MATGWVKDKGLWYYLNESGSMATGWVKDKGLWYYLNESGSMATGWVKDKGLPAPRFPARHDRRAGNLRTAHAPVLPHLTDAADTSGRRLAHGR
ncbi:hypothetical protein AXF24_12445 [Streptococcus pneumoniae]|nr:hypothetical protein AWW74_12460 [Streptococcus pneumoniae]KXB94722.1 hypothetical protein AXF24_12445 [Streptococcus pneumoniae]